MEAAMTGNKIFNRSLSSAWWLLQQLSAVVLLLLLLYHAHFIVRKFILSGTLTYEEVKSLLSTPLNKAIETAFFLTGTFHVVNGLSVLISTFNIKRCAQLSLIYGLIAIGILYFFLTTAFIVSIKP
jgi:succinate dehydrogenase hydrophobic anchor subunit